MAGRRVYRYTSGERKRRGKKAAKIALTVLVLAVLAFVGYSLAGPLWDFFGGLNTPAETLPWTPPVTELTAPVTKIDGDSSETGGTMIKPIEQSEKMTAITIPAEALLSKETLVDNIDSALTTGYTAAVIPLKIKGGALLYKSNAEMAVSAGIVTAPLTAKEIADAVKAAGMTPVCSINLLEDNTRFTNYRGTYKFESDNSRWLDNRLESGGKPWISPFDADAVEYLRFISDEVSKAGFERIIFTGLVFPAFRSSDLNYIGEIVKDPNRADALINVWSTVSTAAKANGAEVYLEMSAAGIALGTEEAFIPSKLGESGIVLLYDEATLPKTLIEGGRDLILSEMTAGERVTVILGLCRDKSDGMELIPRLTGLAPNTESYTDALTAIIQMGFDSYIV
jgi:hypothetical protein